MAEPPRDTATITLRLPIDLLDRIKAAAAADDRSMNYYVTKILEREHPAPPPKSKGRKA